MRTSFNKAALSIMLEGLCFRASVPPCIGDPREVMSLEQRPRDQDDIYAITGLLSKDEDTGPPGLETA